jgi:hypothetical protein
MPGLTQLLAQVLVRVLARVVLVMALVAGLTGAAVAQDRATTCRPFAERGHIWLECCNQSFARTPTRAMSRRARLRSIERCVRNRLRNVRSGVPAISGVPGKNP